MAAYNDNSPDYNPDEPKPRRQTTQPVLGPDGMPITDKPAGTETTSPFVPPAPAAASSNPVKDWITKQAGGQGINPSVASDPAYWERRINETSVREPGGFNQGAQDFWRGLMLRPEGAPEGGSAGGAGPTGSGAPPGATMTPEGTWITAQTDPGKWVDNKGQNWSLGSDGKPVKEGTIGSVPGGPSGPGGFLGPPGGGGTRNPAWQKFYDQLLARSNQGLAVDANDPVIRAQTEAFRNEQTRGSRENLAAIAERAGPNANIGAEQRHAGELVGQNTAGFQAQLMGREVDARRQEIAQALTGMAGQLTAEEMSRLHQEDQALQKRQQDLSNTLSYAQLDLQKELAAQGATQAQWSRAFQDRGWTADQAQRAWDNQFKGRVQGGNEAQQAWEDQYKSIFG